MAATIREARWATAARTDEQVLQDLRDAYRVIGERPLSQVTYDRVRLPGALTATRVMQRYGKWSTACLAADVEPGVQTRTSYVRQWSSEDLWARVAAYFATEGCRGSYDDFSRWTTANPDGPSAQTVRNALGTWNEIKAPFAH